MKTRFIYTLFLLFIATSIFSQKYTLSGYIKDKESGEELLGANILVKDKNVGTTTNAYGFYSLSLPSGKYEITYSFIGYSEITETINLNSNQTRNISLENSAIITQEVIVSGEKNKNVEDSKMSVIKLPVESIKTLPAFMGEVDILKTLQLLQEYNQQVKEIRAFMSVEVAQTKI